MQLAPAPNQPSVAWIYARVKEGTPVTYAANMMREEGYRMSSVMFRYVYRALELMLLARKLETQRRNARQPQRWRKYERRARNRATSPICT